MEVFWSKVKKTNTCWLWQAYKTPFGHGQIRFKGILYKAHRFAWILTYGLVPVGKYVLHTCDVPACVNPKHLYLGTHQDNLNDMYERKRSCNQRKTHCPKGHEYSDINTYIYKNRRSCRTCHNKSAIESRRRHNLKMYNT